MPSFTVEHESKLSQDDTYQKVKKYFEESQGLRKLDENLECQFDDGTHSGTLKGSKFGCTLKVLSGSPTKVQIKVDLNFLLTPFKGKIQETLETKIKQVLG